MATATAVTKGKESKLVPLAVIIAALTGLLISIIAARASFPLSLYYVAVISLLVTIFSLLIYGFLAHPLYAFVKKKREIMKHNALARKYFDEFKHFTERFDEFVGQRRIDNIPHIIVEVCNQDEFREVSLFPTQDIHNLFYHFQERLKRFNGTKEDFSLLVEEFETIFNMYNTYCLCEPVREIRSLGRDKVNARIKEDYRKYKGVYERLIEDYNNFGKKINREFGRRIFRESFEIPEEL